MSLNEARQKEIENVDDKIRQTALRNCHETWADFNAALRSTDDFHAFEWTWKLLKISVPFFYFQFGVYKLKLHIYWRSVVPALAIALIVAVVISYFGSLRKIIELRWCSTAMTEVTDKSTTRLGESGQCRWLFFHDTFVVYVSTMIIFNFLSACFRSPGVVLTSRQQAKNNKGNSMLKMWKDWSSADSIGGFCGLSLPFDVAREALLVKSYYNIADSRNSCTKYKTTRNRITRENEAFPSTQETFCNKCMIKRPPRCHHCSICDRCVLQFDHHCVWLNNCVGYNNYRAFLLTLFYLNIGCWYGIFMLYRPFMEVQYKSSNGDGRFILQDIMSTILELPSVSSVFNGMSRGTMGTEMVNKIVFPFLFAIGLLQLIFFSYHVRYVIYCLTTLEYKILLDLQYHLLKEDPSSSFDAPLNPFSRGWSQNLKDAFGPIHYVFLPIQVNPQQMGTREKKE